MGSKSFRGWLAALGATLATFAQAACTGTAPAASAPGTGVPRSRAGESPWLGPQPSRRGSPPGQRPR